VYYVITKNCDTDMRTCLVGVDIGQRTNIAANVEHRFFDHGCTVVFSGHTCGHGSHQSSVTNFSPINLML